MKRPTKAELASAAGHRVPDIIGPGLGVLFCGINPSLYSAAVGRHFARPGNRFWPTLHRAGFTRRQLQADEGDALLEAGYGITNIVERATAAADELTVSELILGGRALEAKVQAYAPRWVAVLGIGAYRSAWGCRLAGVGRQTQTLGGAGVWVLPNPSGLNAHYDAATLAQQFSALREALDD